MSFPKVFLAVVCLALVTLFASIRAEEPAKVKVEFRRAETKAAEGLIEATVPNQKDKIYLHKTNDLTEADIAKAHFKKDRQTSQPTIDIDFTKDGADKMFKMTSAHLGKPLAILVDGKVICAAIVHVTISERASITGNFTRKEAERIVKAINQK